MTDLAVGSTLAGLRIESVIGRGGMGVVYLAHDPQLDRRVAVKVIVGELAADPDFRRRFRRESRTAAAVHHPHVIPIHWFGEDGGRLFLVMHYVPAVDLRRLIEGSGRLAPDLVATVIGQVAGALDAAHRQDLVHRDVKPANVLVHTQGDAPHAYLTDFGLTRRTDPADRITATGVLLGTFDYMAPELFDRNPAAVASDVYALGCVVFHALTGSVPFPRENLVALVAAHLHTDPPTLANAVADPGLRAALDHVVATALAKDPAQRYPSAGALAAALRGAVEGARPTGNVPAGLFSGPVADVHPPADRVDRAAAHPRANPPTATAGSPAPPAPPGPDEPGDPGHRPADGPTVTATVPPAEPRTGTAIPDQPPAPGRRPTPDQPPVGSAASDRIEARQVPATTAGAAAGRRAAEDPAHRAGPVYTDPVAPAAPPAPRFRPPPASRSTEPPTDRLPASAPRTGPPPAEPAPSHRRTRRPIVITLAVLAVLAAVITTVLLTTAPDTPATPILLDTPVDGTDSVVLTWTGPPDADLAVFWWTADGVPEQQLTGRGVSTATVPVQPDLPYCFQVRGSNGRTIYQSNRQSLRGAVCEG